MGNIKPERRNAGITKKTMVKRDCCWVRETVDMKSPMPKVVKRKRPVANNNKGKLPLNGIPNQKMLAPTTRKTSKYPTMTKGIVFPSINSTGRMGVTINCSIVPISFSLTIAREVRRIVVIIRITATTPGRLKFCDFNSGLYHALI